MKSEIEEIINVLTEESTEKYYEACCISDTSPSLSEWYHGYAEGVGFAIEKLKELISENKNSNVNLFNLEEMSFCEGELEELTGEDYNERMNTLVELQRKFLASVGVIVEIEQKLPNQLKLGRNIIKENNHETNRLQEKV